MSEEMTRRKYDWIAVEWPSGRTVGRGTVELSVVIRVSEGTTPESHARNPRVRERFTREAVGALLTADQSVRVELRERG